MSIGTVGKVVKNIGTGRLHVATESKVAKTHREGLTEIKRRDALSNVQKGASTTPSDSADTRERLSALRRLKRPLTLMQRAACSHKTCALTFRSDSVPRGGAT